MISTRSAALVIDTVVCLTLAKWETVSGRFGGYLSRTVAASVATEHSDACCTCCGTNLTPKVKASGINHRQLSSCEICRRLNGFIGGQVIPAVDVVLRSGR